MPADSSFWQLLVVLFLKWDKQQLSLPYRCQYTTHWLDVGHLGARPMTIEKVTIAAGCIASLSKME